MIGLRLYHGGQPGLRIGELILPGYGRPSHEGCAWCAAREAQLAGGEAPAIDPLPVHRDKVYATTDRLYAKHYASLWGRGWLYRVDAHPDMVRSEEDSYESYVAPSWRVAGVLDRAVLLTWGERRRLLRGWKAADRAAAAAAKEKAVADQMEASFAKIREASINLETIAAERGRS